MGPTLRSIGCVSFLLFSQALAREWPFLAARSPVPEPEPEPTFAYGACSHNGAIVCSGPELYGMCNYGSVVFQPVAEGTSCEDGKIVHKEAEASCPEAAHGTLVCHGSRMFYICDHGKVVYQPVAEGTWCQDGMIVGTDSHPPKYSPEVPAHVPYESIAYSEIPYSKIPVSTIPYTKIPVSTIPYSTIPASTIPTAPPMATAPHAEPTTGARYTPPVEYTGSAASNVASVAGIAGIFGVLFLL